MPKFRKRPVEIEAVQLTRDSLAEIVKLFESSPTSRWIRETQVDPETEEPLVGKGLIIHTLEGDMLARQGDWIIRGVNGELYPCKPDIFEKTYDPVDE